MARTFIDGFELGNTGLWTVESGSPNVTSGASAMGMSGTYYCDMNSGYIYKLLTAANEYWISFRIRFASTSGTTTAVLKFMNTSTVLGTLKIDLATDGYVKVYRGDSSTLCATGTYQCSINNTYRIEVDYKPDTGSSGTFNVKVNGISDIAFTGQTANNALQINKMRFGNGYASWYLDDFVVDSSEYPGNTRIQSIKPSAAGNSTQWDPSTGSNWDCVDEIPYNDTDYVSTNVVDEVDLYALANLVEGSKTISAIKCLQVSARAKQDGAATATKLALSVRTGSTNYFGSDQSVTQDVWGWYSELWHTNPNTSVAWTKSDVDGLEAGLKSRS